MFLLFYIYLNEVFKRENVNERLRKISFFFAMASTVFFILNGLFPGYVDDLFFYWAHGTFALFCYLTAIVYIAIYSYIFLKNQKFSKIHAYMGFVIAGMISVFIFVWISPLQWGFTLPFFVWIFYIPINLLYRKM